MCANYMDSAMAMQLHKIIKSDVIFTFCAD